MKATKFAHDLPEDVSGYYIPGAEVRSGDWRLHHVFIGQEPDFIAWEASERAAGYAPVMIELEHVTKSPDAGERRRLRLLPASYVVTQDQVQFEAASKALGVVVFQGRLDQGALATARRNLGADAPALTGTLQVGSQTFHGVSMRWWAGD